MADISDKLAFISAMEQMKRAKNIADLYMSPPIQHYTALDFGKFEEIHKIGIEYGREVIDLWYESFMKSEKAESFKWMGKGKKNF
jgi:lysophospholipid hydrolase